MLRGTTNPKGHIPQTEPGERHADRGQVPEVATYTGER